MKLRETATTLTTLALISFLPGCVSFPVPQTVQDKMSERFDEIGIQLHDDANESLNRIVSEIRAKYDKELGEVVQNIAEMSAREIVGNKQAAREAMEAADRAVAGKKFPEAKIFCLNAINHSPNELVYFQRLVEIQKKIPDSTDSDWEQVQSILDVGVYQVDGAQEIEALLAMQAEVSQKVLETREEAIKEQKARDENALRDMLQTVMIGRLALDACGNDSALMNERLALLNTLSESAPTLPDEGAIHTRVSEEIRKTTVRIEFYNFLRTIRNYRINIAALLKDTAAFEKSVETIAGMIDSNRHLITSLGALDADALPDGYAGLVSEESRAIEDLRENFNRKRSAEALAEIEKIRKEMKELDDSVVAFSIPNIDQEGFYTKRIADRQEKFKKMVEAYSRVYTDEKDLNTAAELHKKKTEEWSKKRYKAYQGWAIGMLLMALEDESEILVSSNNTAKKIILKYLVNIDLALLEPNVCSLYQGVLGRQMKELEGLTDDDEHSVEIQKKLAQSPKMALENF